LSTWYALMRHCSFRCHGHPRPLNEMTRHAHRFQTSRAVPRAVSGPTIDHSSSAVLHSRVSHARPVSWWSWTDGKRLKSRRQFAIKVPTSCGLDSQEHRDADIISEVFGSKYETSFKSYRKAFGRFRDCELMIRSFILYRYAHSSVISFDKHEFIRQMAMTTWVRSYGMKGVCQIFIAIPLPKRGFSIRFRTSAPAPRNNDSKVHLPFHSKLSDLLKKS
jgi:hypothetical protein